MSGLFGIFNEIENSFSLPSHSGKENSQITKSSRLKSIENADIISTKSFSQLHIKPKGLSIRSKSDQNVSVLNNLGSTKGNPKDKQTNVIKKMSPFKMKTPKSISKNSPKRMSPKKLSPKILSPIMQNVRDDFVFRKPATPKESKYPYPEKLSYDFDPEKYMLEEMENMFNDERIWLRSVRKNDESVISLEDEGFISDAEFDSFEVRNEIPSPMIDLIDVQLPEISDCED